MTTVYFDTFVYNRLTDDEDIRGQFLSVKGLIGLEVIFSDYLFNELIAAWNASVEAQVRVANLFETVLMMMPAKILKQRERIVDDEIQSFLNGNPQPSVFFDACQTRDRLAVMKRLKDGERITNVKCLQDIRNDKIKRYKKIKDIVSNRNPERKSYFQGMDFESVYRSNAVKEEENKFVDTLLKERGFAADSIRQVKSHISHLPYFESYLRMTSAFQFSFTAYKKPERGDDYDLRHFTAASGIDILVCDRKFINILRWAYPRKKCLTYEEFMNHFNVPMSRSAST